MGKMFIAFASAVAICLGACARADVITHGGTAIDMGFQTIGHAGNAKDSTGYGAVGYNYRIATYEVTVDQWGAACRADSSITNGGLWGGRGSGSQPIDQVSWIEATRFCNWLTSGNALHGAYLFSSSNTLTGVNRSAAVSAYGTVYVLPTEDEWYKAAYFTGSGYSLYANGADTEPSVAGWNYGIGYFGEMWGVGSGYVEQNGTYDMMGNVYEWNESAFDGTLNNMSEKRVVRGGGVFGSLETIQSSFRSDVGPSMEDSDFGFRIAAIPEPATALLFGIGGFGVWLVRRNNK